MVFLVRKRQFAWPAWSKRHSAGLLFSCPAGNEHEVIGQMMRHNLAAILYGNYDIFRGLWQRPPNGGRRPERDARRRACTSPFARAMALLPKGTCLNWAYQGMVESEHRRGLDCEIP